MRLSNMADYAVVVMGAARAIAGVRAPLRPNFPSETGIALPTVQKLVSILTKGGLLRSARGAGGGIQLARPAAAITLADIIEAVEGPIAMTNCVNAASCNCAIEPDCNVKPHWAVVNAGGARRAGRCEI
jgi:Rrf2 family protein